MYHIVPALTEYLCCFFHWEQLLRTNHVDNHPIVLSTELRPKLTGISMVDHDKKGSLPPSAIFIR